MGRDKVVGSDFVAYNLLIVGVVLPLSSSLIPVLPWEPALILKPSRSAWKARPLGLGFAHVAIKGRSETKGMAGRKEFLKYTEALGSFVDQNLSMLSTERCSFVARAMPD